MSKRLTKQELIDVVKDRVAEKRLEVSKAYMDSSGIARGLIGFRG